ncbi:DUF7846 domain-containing protein [Frankia sp. AiPs1]|uniref:DUF7846 domain-containing protein n=1 Tax=Frankia sp. AiPa1 TaxID=573492 RepID=UPI00202B4257|nr:glycosyltransferase family 39 protein [Frankia sp. AiPa1]MCL9762925.1 glycosyltransferase family 39 protein [Frankia sp. AiPa1]
MAPPRSQVSGPSQASSASVSAEAMSQPGHQLSLAATPSPEVPVVPVVPARSVGWRVAGWLQGRVAGVSAVGWYVAVLAGCAAIGAVVLRHTVFPLLSVNNDEGIYLLHARTLASGRLFPPAPAPAQSYLPWLGAVVDGHYVLKYTPFVPAVYALGLLLTGSIDPALAVIAAAAVVVTYLLGLELTGRARTAALAASLLALSPLAILQSAMVLSYLPALILMQVAVLGVLRGRRRARAWPVVVAGAAVGVAAAVRPYDVVLLLGPLALWLVAVSAGRRWWLLRWLLCGLAGPAVVVLATNLAATGNPLRLPFALLEPDDRLGFGGRRLYPGDGLHEFGLADGLRSVGDHLWLLGGWACGGVLLAAAAAGAAIRRRLPAPAAMLGLGGVVFLIGYIGFWGAWNAAELWGGIRYVGPFYLVPVLVPLVHLGAMGCGSGAGWLLGRGRRTGLAVIVPLVTGVAVLTGFILTGAVRDNHVLSGHDQDLHAMVTGLPGRSLVFVAASPAFLGHPSPVTANGPGLDGRVLYAAARGVDDLTVAADHPDRPAYLLRLATAYNRSPGSPSTARLERLAVRTGPQVHVRVALGAGAVTSPVRSARLVLTAGTRRLSVPVDPRSTSTFTLSVDADGLEPADLTIAGGSPGNAAGPRVTAGTVRAGRGASVTVALVATDPRGRDRTVDRQILPVRVASSGVTVLGSVGRVGEVGTGAPPPLSLTLG